MNNLLSFCGRTPFHHQGYNAFSSSGVQRLFIIRGTTPFHHQGYNAVVARFFPPSAIRRGCAFLSAFGDTTGTEPKFPSEILSGAAVAADARTAAAAENGFDTFFDFWDLGHFYTF